MTCKDVLSLLWFGMANFLGVQNPVAASPGVVLGLTFRRYCSDRHGWDWNSGVRNIWKGTINGKHRGTETTDMRQRRCDCQAFQAAESHTQTQRY